MNLSSPGKRLWHHTIKSVYGLETWENHNKTIIYVGVHIQEYVQCNLY